MGAWEVICGRPEELTLTLVPPGVCSKVAPSHYINASCPEVLRRLLGRSAGVQRQLTWPPGELLSPLGSLREQGTGMSWTGTGPYSLLGLGPIPTASTHQARFVSDRHILALSWGGNKTGCGEARTSSSSADGPRTSVSKDWGLCSHW